MVKRNLSRRKELLSRVNENPSFVNRRSSLTVKVFRKIIDYEIGLCRAERTQKDIQDHLKNAKKRSFYGSIFGFLISLNSSKKVGTVEFCTMYNGHFLLKNSVRHLCKDENLRVSEPIVGNSTWCVWSELSRLTHVSTGRMILGGKIWEYIFNEMLSGGIEKILSSDELFQIIECEIEKDIERAVSDLKSVASEIDTFLGLN